MAVRQRQMYETAFDSLVQNEVEDLDDIVQSPLLHTPPEKRCRSPKNTLRHHKMSPSTEKRKVTTVRDGHHSSSPRPRKVHVREKSPGPTRDLLITPWSQKDSHEYYSCCTPFSKESSSSENHKKIKNGATKATVPDNASRKSHFLARTVVEGSYREGCDYSHPKEILQTNRTFLGNDYQTPTSDITKNDSSSTKQNGSTEAPLCSNKAFSPSVEFKKLDVEDKSSNEVESPVCQSTAIPTSKDPSESFLPSKDSSESCRQSPPFYSLSPSVTEKGFLRQPMKDRANVSKPTAYESFVGNPFYKVSHCASQSEDVQATPLSHEREHQQVYKSGDQCDFRSHSARRSPETENKSSRSKEKLYLNLDMSPSQKQSRQHLTLDFGWASHNIFGEEVDATVQLQKQGWYHGSISRHDAENILRLLKEGSYLIRSSENSKHSYSLSLKSSHGVIHVKISCTDGKFALKKLCEEFESIPEMIQYYSRNRLPVHGAEHMVLMHPVIDQLL